MAYVKKFTLAPPPLNEVAETLNEAMKTHFAEISVEVVECPNLKEEPFMLAGTGICGKPTLADVGGVPYLVPLAQKDKVYNIKDIAEEAGVAEAFVVGAGAGPYHKIGTNSEMMANVKFDANEEIVGTYIAKLDKDGKPLLEKFSKSTEFCVLGNLFISEGKPGKVLKVHAKKRISNENFVTALRKALANRYGTRPVGVGGVFLFNKGKAKIHIMPDFSKQPLSSDDDVNNWLKFFNMNAPLVCLSCFVSHDPGLDLRIEHTHCFGHHGEGGHFHIDTTPVDAEYLGYFSLAEAIVRIDQPLVSHQIGRD